MRLIIDGVEQTLIEMAAFREAHGLPADFSVTRFESKDWGNVGHIDAGGQALNRLREAVLEAVPRVSPLSACPIRYAC